MNTLIRKILKKIVFLFLKLKGWYCFRFHFLIKRQIKNPKEIPIIIISYNQLNYLKKLIDFLTANNYTNIIIIDNNSTFEPLLDYFKTIEKLVTIHRLHYNGGHMVFWSHKKLFEMYSKGYYVVTDPDIVPVPECPGDFMQCFLSILNKNDSLNKVGFSLRLDNIPDENLNKDKILKWESRFWEHKDPLGHYIADIDTTFALYRPKMMSFKGIDFSRAIRTKAPYMAIHGGWYLDSLQLNEEQRYYYSMANESSSWRIDEDGNLMNNKYINWKSR